MLLIFIATILTCGRGNTGEQQTAIFSQAAPQQWRQDTPAARPKEQEFPGYPGFQDRLKSKPAALDLPFLPSRVQPCWSKQIWLATRQWTNDGVWCKDKKGKRVSLSIVSLHYPGRKSLCYYVVKVNEERRQCLAAGELGSISILCS